MSEKAERRVMAAAHAVVENLQETARRLKRAIDNGDFADLAEIQLSQTTLTIDAIRGAAWAIFQQNQSDSAHTDLVCDVCNNRLPGVLGRPCPFEHLPQGHAVKPEVSRG